MRGKRIPLILLVILVIALPILLLGIKQTLDNRSSAAAVDKLEAEGGIFSGNATKITDNSASGGSFVSFGTIQTSQSSGIYGMGIAGDSLANTPLGGPSSGSIQQFMRFKAEQTSNLVSFRFYYLGPPEPGYAGGTGGSWSIGVYEDDKSQDHLPTGNPITTVTNIPPMSKSPSAAGRLITLSTPVALTAGKIYHLVFTNTDPDPVTNYFSPDYWYYKNIPDRRAGSTPYPSQIFPLLPNSDWGHGYKIGSTWWIREGYLPILDLAYSNGTHQGWSYGEASYNSTDEIGEISGASKMVREKITVSGGDKIITGVGIRALKSSGNSPLIVTLENSSNQTLSTILIPASTFETGRGPDFISPTDWDDLGSPAKYALGNFNTPLTLSNGQTYYLKFSTANDSIYWTWVNRKLISYGYDPATYFKDGVAQYTRDGINWINLGRSKGDQDLQFYLTTTTLPLTNIPTPTTLACPTNLQTAINNISMGGTLDITGCSFNLTSPVTISKSMTLQGGTISTTTKAITLGASNITISGVHLIGPQSTSFNSGQYGIFYEGSALQNINIKNNTIENFGHSGLWIQNISTLNITANTIKNVVYTGIMIISGNGGTISNNNISNIGVTGYEANGMNAYGIALTDTAGTPSTGITISGNTIDNVPQWHGLDTHGGRNLTFSGNIIHRTNRAIFLTGSDSTNGAVQNITISQNTMDTPTKRIDVINTYPYNQVGITVVAGSINVSGTGNKFNGWPAGNHIDTQSGPNNFTNNTITNPQ